MTNYNNSLNIAPGLNKIVVATASGFTPIATANSGILTTDSSGNPSITTTNPITNMQIPNNDYFYAYTAGHSAVTGDGTQYLAIFESTYSNQNSNYSTTTGIYTVGKTGWYVFTACVDISGLLVAHTELLSVFSTNSTPGSIRLALSNPYTQSTSGDYSINGSCQVYLSSGTHVAILVTVVGGTKAVNLAAGAFFSGRFIG